MSGYQNTPRRPGGSARKFDPRLFENPGGRTADFGYGVLKRCYNGTFNTAEGYVRSKLRHHVDPIDNAPCRMDVTAHTFVVNPDCPDLLATPSAFWALVDSSVWKDDQDLALAVTLWFPNCKSHHLSMRAATEFAQARLADDRGLCVQVVAHTPARIGHSGDFHVHAVISARATNSGGLTTYARDLLGQGGQLKLYAEWLEWKATRAADLIRSHSSDTRVRYCRP